MIMDEYKKFLNHEFLQQQLKDYQGVRNLTQKRSRGPTAWKDMRKNVLKTIASWQTNEDRVPTLC